MRNGCAVLVGALLAAALAAGCGGSSSKKSDGGYPGGGGYGGDVDTGGRSGSTGGSTGTGGSISGSGGAGGSASGGAAGGAGGGPQDAGVPTSDGSPGSGGAAGGADASADGATGPPPPPDAAPAACEVTLRAIRPMSFEDLPAGPTSRLRVQAQATGVAAPKTPAWEWTVQHLGSGQRITTTAADMDPSMVEFALATPGNYLVTARATPMCFNSVTATATDHPVAHLWLRVIPRPSLAQPMEGLRVDVPAGGSVNQDLPLGIGTVVSIDPIDATDPLRKALPSYVRINAPGSTVRVEGHTKTSPLTAHLDPALSYDVLVVPDDARAPALYNGKPSYLASTTFALDAGVAVTGHVSSSKGPTYKARMLLSDGAVPSTTGETETTGDYNLRVRNGSRFAATIVPPAKSGLPEARLAAVSGLAIYDTPPGPRVLDFTWNAIETATLDLTITDSAGAAVRAPVRVRLTSQDDAFPDVGTLVLKVQSSSQPEQRYSYHPSGFVQQDGLSDARGFLSITDLPRGKYRATLTPTDGSAAITTVAVDLSGPTGRVALSPRLARKVSVSGKLLPATITLGATLLAIDAEADPTLPAPSATVDADGGYVLHLDPGRIYSLVLEAEPANNLPRTFLRPILGPTKDSVRDDLNVGTGVPVTGRVTGVKAAVGGVLIQAYCVGQSPACIDTAAPDTTNVRPIAETISDVGGNYRLLVPDPPVAN